MGEGQGGGGVSGLRKFSRLRDKAPPILAFPHRWGRELRAKAISSNMREQEKGFCIEGFCHDFQKSKLLQVIDYQLIIDY
jgi:hypothetical protein